MRYKVIGFERETSKRYHHCVLATFSDCQAACEFCRKFGQYVVDVFADEILFQRGN